MPTLRELNVKVGDKFKRPGVKEFVVQQISNHEAYGTTCWGFGQVDANDCWRLDASDDWERIEPDTETEPPQSTYAYLAAQHGIVIIADGVTYDGTKQ